jgi:hypothetical protein
VHDQREGQVYEPCWKDIGIVTQATKAPLENEVLSQWYSTNSFMQFLLSVISSMLLLLHLSLVENDVCGFQGESDRGFRRCQVSLSPGLTQKKRIRQWLEPFGLPYTFDPQPLTR